MPATAPYAPRPHSIELAGSYEDNSPDNSDTNQDESAAAISTMATEAEIAYRESAQPLAEPEGPAVSLDDFEDIFTRYQTQLVNYIDRMVGNREQAYDLTQDVFVKAYRALATGATIHSAALSSWMYRIAHNTATDALRRRRLIAWLPLSLFNEDRGIGVNVDSEYEACNNDTPDYRASAAATIRQSSGWDGGEFEQRVADHELVTTVLNRLPLKYRAPLLLHEHEGLSCAEIAEALGVSPSAVKMRLMRGREQFIKLYKQEHSGTGIRQPAPTPSTKTSTPARGKNTASSGSKTKSRKATAAARLAVSRAVA